jgi:hypothetical protein
MGGTGTPNGDSGISGTDLCESVEFPAELMQVCGDSFAGRWRRVRRLAFAVALHVDTPSVDDPAGVGHAGVTRSAGRGRPAADDGGVARRVTQPGRKPAAAI